jgi:phage terminase large subunit
MPKTKSIPLNQYFELQPKQLEAYQHVGKGGRIFFGGARGGGKVVSRSDTVSTPFGWKKIEDVKEGDLIHNPDGSVQKIIKLHPWINYNPTRVTFSDGTYIDVHEDHLWQAWRANKMIKKNGKRIGSYESREVVETRTLRKWLEAGYNPQIPVTQPVPYNISTREKNKIPPYLLGVLLGDGSITKNGITITQHQDDHEHLKKYLPYGDDVRYKGQSIWFNGHTRKWLEEKLKLHKLFGTKSATKFIPRIYKYGTIEDRWELVRGLMDTDGYSAPDKNGCQYTTISKQLADDMAKVLRSLGCVVTITDKIGKYKNELGEVIECNKAYMLYIKSRDDSQLFNMERKKRNAPAKKEISKRVVSVELLEDIEVDGRCITVSHPNSLYITNDFIVTHNSWLGRTAAVLSCLQVPGLRAIIIRETLDELINNFVTPILNDLPEDIFQYRYYRKDKKAVFANGSEILFRSVDAPEAARKVQGVEYQLMVIDEANNFDEDIIHKLSGSLRAPTNKFDGKFIPTLLMTGNPGGRADGYFKSRFVNPDYSRWKPYEIKYKDRYIFIPAKVDDNKYVNEDYVDQLRSLPKNLREAWLHGNWDVYEGQFFDEWDPYYHVVGDFIIPEHWQKIAGFDLGFTKKHPSVGLWLAQDPARLDVYVYHEYTGTASVDTYARDLLEINKSAKANLFYIDPSMFSNNTRRQEGDESPADMFLREGIPAVRANNDRINGWRVVKQWLTVVDTLENAANPESGRVNKSRLKIMDSCQHLIETLPLLKYASNSFQKKEDVDTKMEDDAADALRYGLVTGFGYPTHSVEKTYSDEIKEVYELNDDFEAVGFYNDFLDEKNDKDFVSSASYYG